MVHCRAAVVTLYSQPADSHVDNGLVRQQLQRSTAGSSTVQHRWQNGGPPLPIASSDRWRTGSGTVLRQACRCTCTIAAALWSHVSAYRVAAFAASVCRKLRSVPEARCRLMMPSAGSES
jgi:hypothetical protein